MELTEDFVWRGRRVRWTTAGEGPAVVFCHGTPWSSRLWAPYAAALCDQFTIYLWDMPGYGASSTEPGHRVSLDIQGELFAALLLHWGLATPHVVAHDFGGAVSLRAHLLHDARYASLALVDVVALAPWGSDFFRLVRTNSEVFGALPEAIHEGLVTTYVRGASHRDLGPEQLSALVEPWRGEEGQAAFYRQIAQADEIYTDEIEPAYASLSMPVHVIWGRDDTWIPVAQGRRLAAMIPGAELTLVPDAGHLIQLDQPVALATALHGWLARVTRAS